MSATLEQLTMLKKFGAATVYEAQGAFGAFDSGIKPLDPTVRIAGPAITIDMRPADNLTIHHALKMAKPGDILVIDAKGFLEAGPWGDILSLQAMEMGLGGLVIDGSVRDSNDIIEMGFPAFSRGLCIKGTEKKALGKINVPIVVAGVTVCPGDIVVGDRDGIVIVPKNTVTSVIKASETRIKQEEEMRQEILAGGSTLQLLGLSDTCR